MSDKLQKIIASAGVASRRKAEKIIEDGRVTVNGKGAVLGDRADAKTDRICVDGVPIKNREETVYYVFNKPRGVVTSLHDDKGRRDLREYIENISERVFPVGRLDMDSSGLMILTNDGEFANSAAHPSREIIKTYLVRVKGFSNGALERLRGEIVIDGHKVTADFVHFIRSDSTSALILIGIHQGLNRQVRKMCALCGMEVTSLTRIAEGGLELGSLLPGEMRQISFHEARKVFLKANIAKLLDNGGRHG